MAYQPAHALTLGLFLLAGLLLLGTARSWMKVGTDNDRPDERPTIPVHAFRAAARFTALSFTMLGAAIIWTVLAT